MTHRWYPLLILFLLIAAGGAAQVHVKGTVVRNDEPPEAVEQATVRLLNAADSAMVKGTVTDREGHFDLNGVRQGNYLLHVTYVGLDPIYQLLHISGSKTPVDVGTITMHDDGVMLGEAVVTARAVEVQVKNDTVEYNAESYKVAEGSMLEDLLKKMPGVEVSSEGKVTVNGKEIKKILVDGKEFFSDDPKVASKNLPAKLVDKVQTYEKKSDVALMTGFDDGNEEAVINLTVKPGMKQGWFGNVFAGAGTRRRYDVNAMLNRFVDDDQFSIMGGLNNTNNLGFTDFAAATFGGGSGGGHRRFGSFGAGNGITASGNVGTNFSKRFSPRLTLGGNVRFAGSDNEASAKTDRQNILPGDSSSYDHALNQSHTVTRNTGFNLRLEWKPDSLTQVVFRPDFSYGTTHTDASEMAHTLNGAHDSVNTSRSRSTVDGHALDASAKLDVSRKLNRRGRTLTLSVSGGGNRSVDDAMNRSDTRFLLFPDSAETIDQTVHSDTRGYNVRGKVAWVEPLGHANFLHLSYRIRRTHRELLRDAFLADAQGQYTIPDTTTGRNTRSNATEHRVNLSLKMVRPKYDLTFGMNFDPTQTRTVTEVAGRTLYDLSRSVVNYSPMAKLRFRFNKRTDLRIDYDGRTEQPSMTQLQPVADVSDPLNTIVGNPDLRPTYTSNLRLHFGKFIPEEQIVFLVMAGGNYVLSDIVSRTSTDRLTGRRLTTYENIDGNFSLDARVILNMPLRNKRFSINSMTYAQYGHAGGFIDGERNTSRATVFMEYAGISFRSSVADVDLRANIRHNRTRNTLSAGRDLSTMNYGASTALTLYLPLGFRLESDLNYSTNSGYTDGYQQREWLWNAAVSKSFLRNNAGQLRVKMYDILRQRSNISYSATASAIRYSEYNTLTSYVLVHFIYRFSLFKGGAKMSDMNVFGPPDRDGRGRRRPRD